MARGQTTEEELKTGLQGIGALDSLRATPPIRRENIFDAAPRALKPASLPPAAPRKLEETVPPKKTDSGASNAPRARESQGRVPQPAPEQTKPRQELLLTDPVTVPMTAEMRTKASLLAAELQRRRTEKSERITANTVFRVAIQLFLEAFSLEDASPVNSEEDLLARGRDLLATPKKGAERSTPS